MTREIAIFDRRKQAVLNGLGIKLRDRDEFEDFLHKDSACCNLNNCAVRSRYRASGTDVTVSAHKKKIHRLER
jgi:hypothetical protein